MTRNRRTKATPRKGRRDRRLRAAYQVAMQLLEREPWLELGNEDYLVFRVDGVPDDHVAVVLGAAGEEFGVMIARGPRAEAQVNQLLNGDDPQGSLIEGFDLLSLYVDRADLLTREHRVEPKHAGIRAKGPRHVPFFMAKRPYYAGGRVGDADRRTLHSLLQAILVAQERGWFFPGYEPRPRFRVSGDPMITPGDPGALTLELDMAGDPATHEAQETIAPEEPPAPAWTADPEDLAGLRIREETWQVLMVVLPGRVQGSPELLRALLVFEPASELVLDTHVVSGPRGATLAADRLLETARGGGMPGRRGLPEVIEVFDPELRSLVAPVLEPAGVDCRPGTRLSPALDGLVSELRDHIERAGPDGPPAPGEHGHQATLNAFGQPGVGPAIQTSWPRWRRGPRGRCPTPTTCRPGRPRTIASSAAPCGPSTIRSPGSSASRRAISAVPTPGAGSIRRFPCSADARHARR